MATLLIVEDDKNTNEAICEYLKSAGHKVIPAYDGAEALQLFGQGVLTLSFWILCSPKSRGYQYCTKLERQAVHPS